MKRLRSEKLEDNKDGEEKLLETREERVGLGDLHEGGRGMTGMGIGLL